MRQVESCRNTEIEMTVRLPHRRGWSHILDDWEASERFQYIRAHRHTWAPSIHPRHEHSRRLRQRVITPPCHCGHDLLPASVLSVPTASSHIHTHTSGIGHSCCPNIYWWNKKKLLKPLSLFKNKKTVPLKKHSLHCVSKKNDNDVLRHNFKAHQPILIIFGRDIAEWICY